MKNYIVTSGVIVSLLVLGCKKVDKLTMFDMEFTQTVNVPASSTINLPFNILTPEVETNAESTFDGNNTKKDLIEEITLTQLKLTLTSPATSDLTFLKSVAIYINASGLPEEKIAWKDSVPNSVGTVMDLEITTANLKDYITRDKYSLRLYTVTDKAITSDHTIDAYSKLHVNATVFRKRK